jgi:hypothetical protein
VIVLSIAASPLLALSRLILGIFCPEFFGDVLEGFGLEDADRLAERAERSPRDFEFTLNLFELRSLLDRS